MKLTVVMRSGRREGDGERVEAAQRVVEAPLDRTGDLDCGDFSRQCGEQHLTLEARDQLADAHMNAGAESDMTAGAAGDVVVVGIFPTPRIAVRGSQKHQDLLALGDRGPADVDIPRRGPEECLYRAF